MHSQELAKHLHNIENAGSYIFAALIKKPIHPPTHQPTDQPIISSGLGLKQRQTPMYNTCSARHTRMCHHTHTGMHTERYASRTFDLALALDATSREMIFSMMNDRLGLWCTDCLHVGHLRPVMPPSHTYKFRYAQSATKWEN